MQLRCASEQLLWAVNTVSHAVPGKSTLPALDGILLRAGNQKLFLAGYDLELGITVEIDAVVEEPGEVVLPSGMFASIVRGLSGEVAGIVCDDRLSVTITGGMAHFAISGMSAAEYPELPRVEEGEDLTVGQGVLRSMIRQTLYAAAQGETSRPVHRGSLIELQNYTLTVVSLDGARMAIRSETVESDRQMSFVLPKKTLSELLKLLGEGEEEKVSLTVAKRHALIEVNGCTMVSRLLDGEFLPYRKAIPAQATTEVTVNTRELLQSVSRAAVVINDRVKSPVVCEFSAGKIQISCSSPQGQARDVAEAEVTGQEMVIGFNHQYLLDALRNTETDEVRLGLSGSLSPMTIRPQTGEAFLFVVLPVRLNNRPARETA